jgi:hypothetical protein
MYFYLDVVPEGQIRKRGKHSKLRTIFKTGFQVCGSLLQETWLHYFTLDSEIKEVVTWFCGKWQLPYGFLSHNGLKEMNSAYNWWKVYLRSHVDTLFQDWEIESYRCKLHGQSHKG